MNLPIDIYLDTCDLNEIARHADQPIVKGFTTNPTLMARAGTVNYELFAHSVLKMVGRKSVSFEVVSEEPSEVMRQALRLQSWGTNVSVKIPMMNSQGDYNLDLIVELMNRGVHVNITAMISLYHVSRVLTVLPKGPAILSVFAGRLADTGHNPVATMKEAVHKLAFHLEKKLLWASVREPGNISDAAYSGCHIITVPPAMLSKAIQWYDRDPDVIAAETSKQFIDDAISAGLTL